MIGDLRAERIEAGVVSIPGARAAQQRLTALRRQLRQVRSEVELDTRILRERFRSGANAGGLGPDATEAQRRAAARRHIEVGEDSLTLPYEQLLITLDERLREADDVEARIQLFLADADAGLPAPTRRPEAPRAPEARVDAPTVAMAPLRGPERPPGPPSVAPPAGEVIALIPIEPATRPPMRLNTPSAPLPPQGQAPPGVEAKQQPASPAPEPIPASAAASIPIAPIASPTAAPPVPAPTAEDPRRWKIRPRRQTQRRSSWLATLAGTVLAAIVVAMLCSLGWVLLQSIEQHATPQAALPPEAATSLTRPVPPPAPPPEPLNVGARFKDGVVELVSHNPFDWLSPTITLHYGEARYRRRLPRITANEVRKLPLIDFVDDAGDWRRTMDPPERLSVEYPHEGKRYAGEATVRRLP